MRYKCLKNNVYQFFYNILTAMFILRITSVSDLPLTK